jgi:hypothetical protein
LHGFCFYVCAVSAKAKQPEKKLARMDNILNSLKRQQKGGPRKSQQQRSPQGGSTPLRPMGLSSRLLATPSNASSPKPASPLTSATTTTSSTSVAATSSSVSNAGVSSAASQSTAAVSQLGSGQPEQASSKANDRAAAVSEGENSTAPNTG